MAQPHRFRNKWWALLGVVLLLFTACLHFTGVGTALPFIQKAFQANILLLQWVTSLFCIVLSMTMIAAGKMADLLGRKKILFFGAAIFGIASFGAGCSATIEILIVFRILQGLGASIIFIVSPALLSEVFSERERVRAISIYGGAMGLGLMIGPFLAGVLIDLLDWRCVFWINLPLIAAGLAVSIFGLKGHSSEKHRVRIDGWSLILLIFGLGALMYGIVAGVQDHWTSMSAWSFLVSGAAALILLIILDKFRKNPLLDLHIFKKHIIVLAALSCSVAGIADTVFMFFDPLYLGLLRGLSPLKIGLLIAVIPAAQVPVSFFFDRLLKWFGVANLLVIAVSVFCLSVILHRLIFLHTPLLFLILPFCLLGVTWGLGNVGLVAAVNQVVAPPEIGAAIGTLATIWNLMGSMLLAISAAIFHSADLHGSFLPAFHSMISFNIAMAALILAAAISIRLQMRRKRVS